MTWFKVDDRIFDNPKIAALSDRAKVSFFEGGTYCSRELTDGFIPAEKARSIARTPKALKELVPHLWEPARGGYMVHDYLKYNPTRERVMAEKEALNKTRSEAGKKGAAARWQMDGKTDGKPSPFAIQNDGKNMTPLPDNPPQPSGPDLPEPRSRFPAREVVVGFEQCFGRLLSPMEIEQVKALEDEHPKERIEYALREAAALNKRSVRYVQRTCERIERDGESNGANNGVAAAGANTNRVASDVRGRVDERESDLAYFRRTGELRSKDVRQVGAGVPPGV